MRTINNNSPAHKNFSLFYFILLSLCFGYLFATLSIKFQPLQSFLVLSILLSGSILFYRTNWALLLIVFIVPIERLGRVADDGSSPISLMRILGIVVLAILLLRVLSRKEPLYFDSPFFIYLFFIVLSAISAFYAVAPADAVRQTLTIIANLMFFFLISNMIRDYDLLKKAILAWIISSTLIALYTVFDWHLGDAIGSNQIGTLANRFSTVWNATSEEATIGVVKRAMGTTSNAAVYGINLLIVLPFCFFIYRTVHKNWQKTAIIIAGLLVTYNIFLTNTRAVMVFFIVLLVILSILSLIKIKPGKLIIGLVITFIALHFVPDAVFKRALDLDNYSLEKSETLNARLKFWTASLKISSDNLLLGVGPGNRSIIRPEINDDTTPDTITSHNEYLQTLLETGLPGIIVFLFFIFFLLFLTFKTANRFRGDSQYEEQLQLMKAIQASMIITILFSLQVDAFHFPLKGWWLIAAISMVMYRIDFSEIKK